MANCLPDLSLMKGPLSTTYYINNLLHLGRIIAKFVIFALASPCSPFHQIRHFPRGHLWHPTWIFVKPMVNFGQIHHFCQILHSVNFSSLQGAPLVILLKLLSALRRFFAIAGCFHYFRHIRHFRHNRRSPRGHFCHPIWIFSKPMANFVNFSTL